jgi:hypothetical protein
VDAGTKKWPTIIYLSFLSFDLHIGQGGIELVARAELTLVQ